MNQNVNFSNQNRDLLIILGIAAINLGIHLLTNGQYGFHRDELYFIDCSKHLDLGYADMPPLTPFLARLDLGIFGESLRGLRVLPALLSSAMVLLTGLMTRELGGRLYAQVLAALAIMVAPVYLIAGTQFQTIPVDQFFWVLTSYLLIRLINTSNQKLWLLIGVVLGLGLLAKYSVLFLAFAIFFSLIISHDRFMFTRIWIWLGALIALLVFLPNIIWQIQNGLPVLIHLQALNQDESTPTVRFLIEQILILDPLNVPIWIAGLLFFFVKEQGRRFRIIGWVYLIPLIIFLLMKGKSYYLAPAYPGLFAGGSVMIESLLDKKKWARLKYIFPALLLVTSVITSPVWLPILSVEKIKKLRIADFRYDFREMIGWPEMVSQVSKVYHGLSPAEQMNTMIITGGFKRNFKLLLLGTR
jgi:4-amino-4-deoxy-L-arabinose transferase-like glycosyltransferase